MAKYDVTYACGHSGVVDLVGPTKDRESRLEWYKESALCPDCWAKEKAKEKAAEQATVDKLLAECEAPALTGSPKQMEWAAEIRYKFILKFLSERKTVEHYVATMGNYPDEIAARTKQLQDMSERFYSIVHDMGEARFWIDNRYRELGELPYRYRETKAKQDIDSTPAAEAAKSEAIMVPPERLHPAAVEVKIVGNTIQAFYRKDDDFYNLAKKYHLRWNPDTFCRDRKCNVFTGSAQDRAAELINALLLSGFSVSCMDADVRKKAQDASFAPECRRWVVKIGQPEKFGVRWDRDDQDFYADAKRIPGARWEREALAVLVPATSWREVQDFATINGFTISPGAKALIESANAAEIPVDPEVPVKPAEADKKEKLDEILHSSKEVLPDLRDD